MDRLDISQKGGRNIARCRVGVKQVEVMGIIDGLAGWSIVPVSTVE